MFNINKIINRIRDPERVRDSPPQSPSRKLDETDAEESAEGFLCPTCMKGFPSPEDLQAHYEDTHSEKSSENQHGQLCPVCRMKMKTTRELQEHYAAHHVTTKNGDLETLKQELTELQTTLREEKWYSDDLKREIERLQVTVNSKGDGDKSETEDLYRVQIKSLEETKSLLSSEVMLLRKQLAEAVATNMSIKQEKERIEQKAAAMSSDLVSLKANIDQELGVKAAFEESMQIAREKIISLEAELQQRPEADDVAVLQQELVQVQTLMNKTTIEREQEKERLEADFEKLKAQYGQLEDTVRVQEEKLKNAPKSEEVESLKAVLSESSSGTQQLQTSLQQKIQEFAELDKKFYTLEKCQTATMEELKAKIARCDELEQQLGAKEKEAGEIRDKLKETNATCHQLEQKITLTTEAMKANESDLSDAQKTNNNLRQSLQQQLLEKEQHLNQVNLQLEETVALLAEHQSQTMNLNRQLSTLQSHFQEQSVELDDVKSTLWEKDNQIEADSRQLETGNAKQKELEECVVGFKERMERLECERTELHAKIESGEGAATVIQQLTQEAASLQEKLNEQQHQTEMQAEISAKKLDKLHKSLQETKSQLQNSNENCRKLEATMKDLSADLSASQDKVAKLESGLKTKVDQMHTNDASHANVRAELEHLAETLQLSLTERENEVEKLKEKNGKTRDDLAKQIKLNEDLQSNLFKEVDKNEKLQEKCRSLDLALTKKSDLNTVLTRTNEELSSKFSETVTRLESAESYLQQKEESIKSLTKSTDEVRNKLENQIHRMESERTELLNTKNSLEKEIAETCDNVARKMAELHESHHRITTEKNNLEREFEENRTLTADEVGRLKELLTVSQSAEAEGKANLIKSIEKIKSLEDKVTLLETARSNLMKKSAFAEQKLKEKDIALENHIADLTRLKTELDGKDKSVVDLQAQLEGAKTSLQKEEESSGKLKDQLLQLNKSYNEMATECTRVGKLLEQVETERDNARTNQEKTESQLEESRRNEETLTKSLEDLNQVKTLLGQEMIKMDTEFKDAIEELQRLTLQKTSLETELFNKQKELSEVEEKLTGVERTLVDAQQRLEEERQVQEKEMTALQAARQLLLHQKTELYDQLTTTEQQLAEERKNHAQTHESLQNELDSMESELRRVSSRLEEMESAHLAVVREKEEGEARLKMEVGALNENVTTLRADLKSEQTKTLNLETSVRSLSGEKLDLEARLENALDERRALLERCLASESECDKLRNSSTDLRHKLDEALAAVHELGRENQTLQIESAKLTSRKWADDSEAASCTLCQKIFSVTIRKHHCRNCGNIFCNECSTRSAAVASSKKPVRVCDLCYAEMSK